MINYNQYYNLIVIVSKGLGFNGGNTEQEEQEQFHGAGLLEQLSDLLPPAALTGRGPLCSYIYRW